MQFYAFYLTPAPEATILRTAPSPPRKTWQVKLFRVLLECSHQFRTVYKKNWVRDATQTSKSNTISICPVVINAKKLIQAARTHRKCFSFYYLCVCVCVCVV